LLPQYENKDRPVFELALKQMAQHSGLTHSAHIITPEFTKRLMSLK
jgi:hypothetical protein